MQQQDVLALYGHDSPKQKWYKLKADYNLVSDQMATEARAKLFAFKMGGGETVIETQHRFAVAASECAIQGVPEPDAVLARILMTYPSDRWRQFVDTIALRQPLPPEADIFAGMKMLEERQNARDAHEYGEANFAGRAGGGQQLQQQQKPKLKLPPLSTAISYCCGGTRHYANKCSICLAVFCSFCKVQGHVLAVCKRAKDAARGSGDDFEGAGDAHVSEDGADEKKPL